MTKIISDESLRRELAHLAPEQSKALQRRRTRGPRGSAGKEHRLDGRSLG